MWQKLPVWFRAVLTGLLVAGIPTLIWAALAAVNLKMTPRVPWSVAVMAAVLWAYWRYVRRDERARATRLAPKTWHLALLAGGSGIAAVWAAFAALRGLLHITPPGADLVKFPVWTIFAAIAMGSAVAGVAEETGFRGYMQLPLERTYGPIAAITTTSTIFTLIHLTHGRPVLPFLPFYFVAAVIYSLLALLTNSNFPAMLLHFAGDVMMFAIQYLMVLFAPGGAARSGHIAPVPAVVALLLATTSVMLFRMLWRSNALTELNALPS